MTIKDFLLDSLNGIVVLFFIFFILICIGSVVVIGINLYKWNSMAGLIYGIIILGAALGQLGDYA